MQKFEMETAINWDEENKTANFYTCSRKLITKLDKLCEKYPDTYKVKREIIIEDRVIGKEYLLPAKLISIRTPSTRVVTDEQKEAARERFKNMHSK